MIDKISRQLIKTVLHVDNGIPKGKEVKLFWYRKNDFRFEIVMTSEGIKTSIK